MITSILQESNSPTLGSARRENRKVIQSKIWDAFEREFPIEISYSYDDKLFDWTWGTLVTDIDHNLCPSAHIDKADLMECIRDIIREEENGSVTFE